MSLKKVLCFYIFLSSLHGQDSHLVNLGTNKDCGRYQFSEEYKTCCDSNDFIKKHQTFAEQETACLQKELSRLQTRFDVTLNLIIFNMKSYSKKDIPKDQKQLLQDKIKYLQKSSVLFHHFIEKFCDENSSHLYGCRYAYFARYSQFIDFLNVRLHHLEDLFSYPYSVDDFNFLFTTIIEDILKKSKDNKTLTDLENERIDIFLRLSHLLKNSNFDVKKRALLLEKLDFLFTHENNAIAKALYNKFKSLF